MTPLVTADWLAEHRNEPELRIGDVRWYLGEPDRGRAEYARAHIPGSVFVDLERDLSAPTGGGRHPLPAIEEFATRLGELGIGSEHTVVAYDDRTGSAAARLWWMLRSAGHRRVALLDGGFAAWQELGLPTTEAVTPIQPATLHVSADWTGVVDRARVAAYLAEITLIDARLEPRYRGDEEPVDPVAGHIPTAINIPYAASVDSEGRFLAPADLAERFRVADEGKPVVVYCGSGVTACHSLVAMELAGIEGALLYPGSWSDWCAAGMPVAIGAEPGA